MVATALVSTGIARASLVDFGGGLLIDFTTIGDPGNAADATGSPNPAGSVGYEYRISTYEISRAQVEASGLVLSGDIDFTDPPGIITGDTPATGISWFEAATFVNFLNTSQGHQAAYKFSGSSFQLWTGGDPGFDASNPYRNSLAQYWLPSVDEWYKAAYYDPNTMTWFNYPTGSDTAPTAVSGGTTAGTAVYGGQSGPADVDNAGGLSPYGTMGQGGNVWEWEETAFDLGNYSTSEYRGLRGGRWLNTSNLLQSSYRLDTDPTFESSIVGFRVAGAAAAASGVPEPSTALGLLGLVTSAFFRRRRRLLG